MLVTIAIGFGCLLLLEGIVRLFFPKPPRFLEPQVRVVLDNRIGYCNHPNQTAFSKDSVATINRLGFRGPEIQLERQPNSFRVLGLGNSISFGGGLADNETYFAYLNEQLNTRFPDQKNEVLNASIYGFTIRQYIPFLESVLPKVKPDVVLIGAAWRDLHYNPRFGQLQEKVDEETWENIKKKFRERIEKPDFPSTKKERSIKKLKNLLRYWRTVFVANYYLQVLKDVIKPPNYHLWQRAFLSGERNEEVEKRRVETRKTLRRMKRLCEQRNIQFAVLIFPDYKQINKVFPKSFWPSLLTDICDELGIPYIDLLSPIQNAYAQHGRSIFLPYDVHHYSAEVHGGIAEALFEFLQDKELLKQQKTSQVVVA